MRKLINRPEDFVDEICRAFMRPIRTKSPMSTMICAVMSETISFRKVGWRPAAGRHPPLFWVTSGRDARRLFGRRGLSVAQRRQMLAVTKAIDGGSGVCYYGNYTVILKLRSGGRIGGC